MKLQRAARKEHSHIAIAEQLGYRIRSGVLEAGSMLPSRRMLAEEFGAAVGTVQKAIDELVADGRVVVQGRTGTFVAGQSRPERVGVTGARGTEQRQLSIGVVVWYVQDPRNTELGNAWTRRIIQEIESAANRGGSFVSVRNRYNPVGDDERLLEAVERMDAAGYDVIIVINRGLDSYSDPELVRLAASRPIVVVAPWYRLPHPFLSVATDQKDAGCQAAMHLLQNGVSRLMFLSHIPEDWHAPWVERRADGVRAACKQYGLDPNALDFVQGADGHRLPLSASDEQHSDAAYWAARKALDSGVAIEAVIAVNDFAAYGFLTAASEHGLMSGRDYLLVGFDDAPRSLELGLTSLNPPLMAMGREALRAASMAARREQPVLRCELNSHVTVRRSSIWSDRSVGDFEK